MGRERGGPPVVFWNMEFSNFAGLWSVGASDNHSLVVDGLDIGMVVSSADKCGVDCSRMKNFKRIRRSLRRLRRMINSNRQKFAVQ